MAYYIHINLYYQSKTASLIFSLAYFWHKITGLFNLIDGYVFPTQFIRNYYVKYGKISKEKTIVIPTFTDISKLRTNNKLKISEKNFFLFVGRLSEEKGIVQLLEIFKSLPKKKLVVIGDGPLINKVKEYVCYKNIFVKGFKPRNEILLYLKKAIAVIVPSLWYDVMPNVIIESISQKTLVFVPNFGPFPEIMEKYHGLIHTYDDYQSLRNLIVITNSRKKLISTKTGQLYLKSNPSNIIEFYKFSVLNKC
jgi:glycosyltransferase involved in cell wall biosynthesis